MNRVKEYYDFAVEYLSLPIGVRFDIAIRFKLVTPNLMVFANREELDRKVFEGIARNNLLPQYRAYVAAIKKSRTHEYPLN